MVKKVSGTRKYYLTKLGKSVITLGLKTREIFIIPGLKPLQTDLPDHVKWLLPAVLLCCCLFKLFGVSFHFA